MEKTAIKRALTECVEKDIEKLMARKKAKEEEIRNFGVINLADIESFRQREECRREKAEIEKEIATKKGCLKVLQTISDSFNGQVACNSIVTLENDILVIMPKPHGCGACSTRLSGREIICVSPKAPLVELLLNKGAGDIICSNGEKHTIVNVQ